MGARGVQIDVRTEVSAKELSDTGRRQFLHSLSQFNLKLASTWLPTRGAIYDARNLDQRVNAIRLAMQFAHQLGTDTLAIAPGPVPEAGAPERATLVEVLSELARHGNHVGTTLCLRSGGNDPTALKELLETIDDGPLGIDFDPAAAISAGRDPLEDYRGFHSLVRHVRATDSVIGPDNSTTEVPVGRGRVPWLELVVTLGEGRFAGWMTVERTSGDHRARDLAEGLEFLKPELPV